MYIINSSIKINSTNGLNMTNLSLKSDIFEHIYHSILLINYYVSKNQLFKKQVH